MATTISFDKCKQCGGNNPKNISTCRHCGAPLPWAKPVALTKPSVAQRAQDISLEPLIFWLFGLLLFIVSCAAPMFGYMMYRYFSNEESNLTPFVSTGAVLGLLIWALGFVSIMAHVGKPPA